MQSTRAGLVEPKRFELIDVELAPGPGEVLVEVAACGICSSELPVYTGQRPVDKPAFLGHEGGRHGGRAGCWRYRAQGRRSGYRGNLAGVCHLHGR